MAISNYCDCKNIYKLMFIALLKEILLCYEGQKVNLGKSVMVCCSNATGDIKKNAHHGLGTLLVNYHEKYLG